MAKAMTTPASAAQEALDLLAKMDSEEWDRRLDDSALTLAAPRLLRALVEENQELSVALGQATGVMLVESNARKDLTRENQQLREQLKPMSEFDRLKAQKEDIVRRQDEAIDQRVTDAVQAELERAEKAEQHAEALQAELDGNCRTRLTMTRASLHGLIMKWREEQHALARKADAQGHTRYAVMLGERSEQIAKCADELAALLAEDGVTSEPEAVLEHKSNCEVMFGSTMATPAGWRDTRCTCRAQEPAVPDLRACVERMLFVVMDAYGDELTIPDDSDGRFVPAEYLRALVAALDAARRGEQR